MTASTSWLWNLDLADVAGWREVNFGASLCLYAICGLLWLLNGSLASGWAELRRAVRPGAR